MCNLNRCLAPGALPIEMKNYSIFDADLVAEIWSFRPVMATRKYIESENITYNNGER